MVTWYLVAVLGLGVLLGGGVGAAPLVTAPWGRLAGVDWNSPSGGRYSAYLAVPFALPPVGTLRFQKPQPHPGISSVHNTSKFGPTCMQSSPFSGAASAADMSEDCLTLNVFVPGDPSTRPASGWAVMVWVHGGGYELGSAKDIDPWRLVADNNVIVVTIQYRLGPFGFLATGDGLLPGNWGLWDQTLAIKWVKDNIPAFGGDNSGMTIFGESAGSGSVTTQLLSTHASGLFQRVIGQSFSASSGWSVAKSTPKNAKDLAVGLGCLPSAEMYSSKKDAMLSCLQAKDAKEILTVAAAVVTARWSPVVDGEFLTKHPYDALRDPVLLQSVGFFDHDLMMGVNNYDGTVAMPMISRDDAQSASKYRQFYGTFLQTRMGGDYNPDILDMVEYEYTYPRDPRHPNNISLQMFLFTAGDMMITADTVDFCRAHSRGAASSGRTYLYHFEHDPAAAVYRGMAHAQDVAFLFSPSERTPVRNMTRPSPLGLTTSLDSRDLIVAQVFAAFLADFAKTGNPNLALTGNLPTATLWPEFDPMEESYLAFAANSSVQKHLNAKRVSLFLDIIPRVQQRWQSGSNGSCETEPARLSRFNLDVGQAEVLIIALLAASSVLLLLLLAVTYSACSQRSAARAIKYKA